MVDGRTRLTLCVAEQCRDLGSTGGPPGISLNGTDLRLVFNVNDSALDDHAVAVRLIATGAVVGDSTLNATPHVDHHGGCSDSRFIHLRYDEGTKQLLAQ